jgi:hypothetical protein
LRKFSGTTNKTAHPGIPTPFPSGYYDEVLKKAKQAKPDVLVLVLFGQETANAIRKAHEMGLKNDSTDCGQSLLWNRIDLHVGSDAACFSIGCMEGNLINTIGVF